MVPLRIDRLGDLCAERQHVPCRPCRARPVRAQRQCGSGWSTARALDSGNCELERVRARQIARRRWSGRSRAVTTSRGGLTARGRRSWLAR